MKINLEQAITVFDGSKLQSDIQGVDLTYAQVCINALMSHHTNEQATGEQKFERYQLAKKINDAKGAEVEFTPEQIVMIKNLAANIYTPIVIGQLYELLNG